MDVDRNASQRGTRRVPRWATAALGVLAAAAPAWAQPAGPGPTDATGNPDASRTHLPGKARQEFWTWLLSPHEAEIKIIVRKVAENKRRATTGTYAWDEYPSLYSADRAEEREQLLLDAEGMLRYGLRLVPGHLDLQRELAIVTDENDRPRAEAALERYVAAEVPDRVGAEVRMRLGRRYARQRRFSEAVTQLRMALGTKGYDPRSRIQSVLLLGSILMHTGRLAEAIDLLRGQIAASPLSAYSGPEPLIQFALAVAYDRDEQLSLAHDMLARIMSSNNDSLLHVLGDNAAPPNRNPLVPPVERHYFAGLQYEALGYLQEARAEWQAYAAADDAPYRERARQHIAGIDRLLGTKRHNARATAPARTPREPTARRRTR